MATIMEWRTNLIESEVSSSAKLVGFCLSMYYRKNKPTFPSQETLMHDASYGSRNTIGKAVHELTKKKLLKIDEKRVYSNSFKSFCYIFTCSNGEQVTEQVTEQATEQATAPSLSEHKVVNKNNNILCASHDELFEKLWKVYPNKKGKKQVSKSAKKEIYELGAEHFERCMQRYVKYVESQDWLKYQNGSTFFNGGYLDYIDETYAEEEKELKAKEKSIEDKIRRRLTSGK